MKLFIIISILIILLCIIRKEHFNTDYSIDNIFSDIASKGDQGPIGITGITGLKGLRGNKGLDGDQGARGYTGSKGRLATCPAACFARHRLVWLPSRLLLVDCTT